MIHRIHSYLPDRKTYIRKSYCDNSIDKTLEYSLRFSIDFEITIGKSPEKYGMMLGLKRMLQ